MSCDQAVIQINSLSKCYQIYDRPHERLLQSLWRGRKHFFRPFWALRDVSFEVTRGETVGIVGRNGSGKSTLLQLISGTLTPTSGDILINGNVAALLELGAGFNPEFTGRENVYLNGAILGLSTQEIESCYEDIVSFADIGDFLNQPVKTYSSGMYIRLAFSVAINVKPEILIIDEALSVGDEAFQRKCFSKIQKFKQDGGTILFVSHSGATIVELCDRAILLDKGELLGIAKPKVVVSKYQKLIFAPGDKAEIIRNEIKSLISTESSTVLDHVENTEEGEEKIRVDHDKKSYLKAYYDPFLESKSTFRYISRGAQIENPKIATIDGERVNLLVRGGQYIYSYSVIFSESAMNVRFGMLIKTITGLELGGAVSATLEDALKEVKRGDVYDIQFRFKCALNPGAYFLNAGVVGTLGDEEIYLDRIIDAVMVKVQPEDHLLGTAIVDFDIIASMSLQELE